MSVPPAASGVQPGRPRVEAERSLAHPVTLRHPLRLGRPQRYDLGFLMQTSSGLQSRLAVVEVAMAEFVNAGPGLVGLSIRQSKELTWMTGHFDALGDNFEVFAPAAADAALGRFTLEITGDRRA